MCIEKERIFVYIQIYVYPIDKVILAELINLSNVLFFAKIFIEYRTIII